MLTNILDTIIQRLQEWGELFVENLPNIIAGLLVLLLFYVVARVVRHLLERAARHAPRQHTDTLKLVRQAAYIAIILAGLLIALRVTGLQGAVASVAASVGIVGLALSFAFRDIAENVMSGVILMLRGPFEIEDVIETNDHLGRVTDMNLRFVKLKTFERQIVYIPNSDVLQNPIINYTQSGVWRVDIIVGVHYDSNLEEVEEVALEAARSVDGLASDPDAQVVYREFGDSSVNFQLRLFVDIEGDGNFLQVLSDGVKAIHRAFAEHDIEIPFPIRTLEVGEESAEKIYGRRGGKSADSQSFDDKARLRDTDGDIDGDE